MMDSFLWWSGVALWLLIGAGVAFILVLFLRAAWQSIAFTRRCLPKMGFKADLSRWRKFKALAGFTWGNIFEAPTVIHFQGHGSVYWNPAEEHEDEREPQPLDVD